MKKTATIFALLLLAALHLGAQGSIRIQAPNLVAVGEQFNLTFIIEGENAPTSFDWEPGDGFQLIWGPQKGSSTSISINNGKKTKSSQVTYTYILLARKAGTWQIPAATAVLKGKELVSGRHSIEVVADGSATGASSGQGGQSQSRQNPASTGTIDGSDLFLRLSLSKSSVVVGEPLTATLKIYSRVTVAGFEDIKFPSFGGFWSQDLQGPSNIEFRREKYGEAIYDAAVLRSWTLIPQQAGEVAVEPAELVCQVTVRAPRASTGSIFDSFFQDDYRTIRKRLASPAATVRVRPLPSGAPSSFCGGVGTFSVTSSLTRDSLRTHDAASLRITVSGKGNISLLEAPKVSFPPDFEVYDVKVTENTDKVSGRLSGSKTFEYPFIPRSHGDFTVPPVEFSYYDVNAGRYVTVRTKEMNIKVLRGSEAEAAAVGGQVQTGVIRKDVRDLGSDIRFIRTKAPDFRPGSGFFVLSPLFWGVLALLVVLAAILYVVLRQAAERRADVAGSRVRAASKMARRRLSKAEGYLTQDLYSAFYEELHKALLGFISDKLGLDVFDMSKENISGRLIAAGVPEGLASDYVALLEACEFARYSSSEGHDAMKTHFDRAVAVISGIDARMKHSRSGKVAAVSVIAAVLLLQPAAASWAAPSAADSLWNAAVAAYSEGRWEEARSDWNGLTALGVKSPDLYYNMGNACFKAEDYAGAILNYERALKLDPSFSDARFNLAFAGEFVQDRIETLPEFFLKTWARKFRWLLPSDAWAVLFLLLFAGFLAMLLLFVLATSPAGRKTGFYLGIALLLLSAACLGPAVRQRADSLAADSAIITSAVVSVGSAPGADGSKDLFVLHEGAKVKILDEAGEWRCIEIADGRRGWIRASQMEII